MIEVCEGSDMSCLPFLEFIKVYYTTLEMGSDALRSACSEMYDPLHRRWEWKGRAEQKILLNGI